MCAEIVVDNFTAVHAFSDDALGDSDAVALAEQLRCRQRSALELAQAAIKRAEYIDPVIRAVELPCYDRARTEATAGQSGYFAGVPTFVKDNTDVAGLPTNHGSAALNAAPAKQHDAFARQFLAQGFTVIGKSTLPEFGLSATTEFAHREPTRNPWNPAHSTGASSGGSAALVAAGVVPIAQANDGGGSIRIPAACCGLVGLKASRGRHRQKPVARLLPVNLISEGVVTRSVRDTAFFHAMAERTYRNPRLPEIGLVEGPAARRLRIGLWQEPVTGDALDAPTKRVVEDSARLLEGMGHKLEVIPPPLQPSFVEDFSLYWSMLAFLFEKTGRLTVDASFDSSRIDDLTRGLSNQFKRKFYKAPQFIWRLRRTHQQCLRLFQSFDVILSPTLSHTTPRLGYLSPTVEFDELFARLMRYVGFTPWANASGGPAISLPIANTEQNLPVSIQLFANYGEEKTLLELAYEIEGERPWRKIQSA
jgi:amidase